MASCRVNGGNCNCPIGGCKRGLGVSNAVKYRRRVRRNINLTAIFICACLGIGAILTVINR